MTGHDIDKLANEAMGLMRAKIDDLYATLGCQLLGRKLPSRMAGIVSYMSVYRRASQARDFIETLPSRLGAVEWDKGVEVIYEDLRRDGIRYLTEVSGDLRHTLCNEEITRLSDQVTSSTIKIVMMAVGAALRLPPEADSICATVTVIILKLGLRDFCRDG